MSASVRPPSSGCAENMPVGSSSVLTATSIVIRHKRKAANASPLGDHFTKCFLLGTKTWDKTYCTCNYCHERVLCKTEKNGTSSMWSHSRGCEKHPLFAAPDSKQSKLNKDNVTRAMTYYKYNKKRCDDRCIKMIIKDELPFRFVQKDEFKKLCAELEPQWPQMNRKKVAKDVLDRYNLEKGLLLSQL